MSAFECMKLRIHYRGDVAIKDKSFDYKGGDSKEMLMDPDLMTWSIFDEFCKENGVSGEVEDVWYKLPQEDLSSARCIGNDKDGGIRELCLHAAIGGVVDIYLDNGVSVPQPFPIRNEEVVEDDEVEPDEEGGEGTNAEEIGVADNGEDPVEETRIDTDPRFEAFYEEINNNAIEAAGAVDEDADPDTNEVEEDVLGEEDEEEFERQCFDAERPDHVVDTDDEWDAYDQQERATSRSNYTKDKEPYLWLLQKFHSGEEFKDQLLRYVLKTNYDVKLCRWGATKLAAICRHKKCKWKIYCSSHKRTRKWIVQTYVDAHNHGITGKARMLKQGVIARMFRDEARRRPNLRWTDIKDEIMMRYTLSMSKWVCQKARRMALDMVIETQKQQFAKLYDYEAELQSSNAGIHTEFARIKEPGESSTNPAKASREGLTVTCTNCKQPGHNKGTCKNPTVQSAPTRKRGRPKKRLDNDDPWSINNAPKRWQQAQSQSTPSVAQTQSTQNPQHSSAPAAPSTGKGRARGRPPGVRNGEGKGRGKGRGKKSDEAPKPPIFFMSPWTDKVFDVWQPGKK